LKALFLLKKNFEETDPEKKLNQIVEETLIAVLFDRSQESFYFFAKEVLEFDLMTDQTHKKWADDLQFSIKDNKKRFMRLKPRGTYKTTLYGVAFILWLWACQSPQIRIFYTSSNILLLQEVSDKLSQFIGTDKSETFFSYLFGIVRDPIAKNTGDVFNIMGRSGKGFSLILRTSGGSTVGIHPNVIIVDDPLDQNDRESEATRNQKERWFDSLTPLLVPFKCDDVVFESIFYIGTVWHMQDLTYHIQKRNEKLPDAKKWDIEIEGVLKDDGTASYPEFFPMEKILEVQAGISEEFFACQYLNKALPEGLQIFKLEKLTFVREEQLNLKQGQLLCVFDPSRGKQSSDFPAVWWVHFFNNIITFYDAIDEKTELSILIPLIASRNKLLKCTNMLFEENGTMLMDSNIERAHKNINWYMNIETIHHSTNKDERILSMQPDLYSPGVQFMDDYKDRYPEAMNQIVFYPVYGKRDFPDCAHMAIEYFRQDHFVFTRYEACR
jgi:hypothetical protein